MLGSPILFGVYAVIKGYWALWVFIARCLSLLHFNVIPSHTVQVPNAQAPGALVLGSIEKKLLGKDMTIGHLPLTPLEFFAFTCIEI